MTPFLLVLSAPSGGGKTTIAKQLLQGRGDLGYSVSATTRPVRPDELDGRDYHFLTRGEFERRQKQGDFIESASYAGELYGTLRSEIDRIFAEGRHAVLDVEIEGARQIRRTMPNALLVFVLPPSAQVLVERLTGRNTEDPKLLKARLSRAAEELQAVNEYDYAIVNRNLSEAVAEVSSILDGKAASRLVKRQKELPEIVEELRRDVIAAAKKIGKEKVK